MCFYLQFDLLCVYLIEEVLSSEHADFFFFLIVHEHRQRETAASSLRAAYYQEWFYTVITKIFTIKMWGLV